MGTTERQCWDLALARVALDASFPAEVRTHLSTAWRKISARLGTQAPEPSLLIDDDAAHLAWRSPRFVATLDVWSDGKFEWFFTERASDHYEGSNGLASALPERFFILLGELSRDA